MGWEPNGRAILFASDRTGTTDIWSIPVFQGQPRGAPMLVKKDVGEVRPLGLTRDGSYYYGLPNQNANVYVAALDPQTGAVLAPPASAAQRFLGSNRSPDWSRDGRHLAYVSQPISAERATVARIFIHPAATTEGERELRPKLYAVDLLCWAPRGRSFLVTGYDPTGGLGLFEVDAQTGDATPIVERSEARDYFHAPAWSADGKTVFYKIRNTGLEPARLLARDLATGQEKELAPSVYRYDLSRDGKWLAFCTFDEKSTFITIIPAGGGEPRELYREPRSGLISSIAWMPDGRYLLFTKRGELWRLPLAEGHPEKLALAMDSLRELRVHPDGGQIAFTAGSPRGEVWVLENFLPEL